MRRAGTLAASTTPPDTFTRVQLARLSPTRMTSTARAPRTAITLGPVRYPRGPSGVRVIGAHESHKLPRLPVGSVCAHIPALHPRTRARD